MSKDESNERCMDTNARLSRLLEIMARLRDPETGCPWDIEQDFASIAPHTLEEVYEVIDAIERGDHGHLADELGDLMFQVVFYARLGKEAGLFDFDTIVDVITSKLLRRHPHVFPAATLASFGKVRTDHAEAVTANWEAIKAKEKGRTSSLDGIAMAQPALPLVEKLIYRAEKYKVELPMADVESASQQLQSAPSEETVGQALASIIALAHQHGIDPESSLRGHARAMIEKIRQSEAG